ncbi:MAG: RdgB/HAM1 family non-canonical purine NTP pyrophosphatase [Candidatus Promineifilaceae bacterium]|nr:RdgB/HAM1 family non-canonical purine NTP pyrophosphatase [Candidatus Promineifilaceae bacterium]
MAVKLLVATHNQGKVDELTELLAELDVEWLSLHDVGITESVAETGTTLRENAILKARTYARATGMLTLADDTGLEVDALGGQPGVHTARYGGEGLTPPERYTVLLENMDDVPEESRTARFRTVVALATPAELVGTAEGVVEGQIAREPSGEHGFGYDPVFIVAERGETMAELPASVKNRISHRGRAMAAIAPLLRQQLAAAP